MQLSKVCTQQMFTHASTPVQCKTEAIGSSLRGNIRQIQPMGKYQEAQGSNALFVCVLLSTTNAQKTTCFRSTKCLSYDS